MGENWIKIKLDNVKINDIQTKINYCEKNVNETDIILNEKWKYEKIMSILSYVIYY